MKKNNLLKTVLLFVFTILFLQGCRNESLIENKQESITNKKIIKILNAEEVEREKSLISEVNLLKKKVFKQHKSTSRSDNSSLDNAIIETEKVLLVEDGEKKTYTFPVSRTYPNSMIENLVLRKNNDSTFSGILLQYNLTAQEKESIKQGKEVDLKSKIKIFEIDKIKINVNSRLQTDVVGCYEITWQTGYCKSGEHESGNDSECVVGGAPSPSIISIVDLCAGTDTQQDTSYSSGGDTALGGSPSSGGGGSTSTTNPDLSFNTFIFSSFDDQLQVCPTGDAQCIDNWQFNLSLQQYLQSLNFRVSGLSSYTPTLLTIRTYFLEQGLGDVEMSFMTDKLTFFSNWFNSTSTQNISSTQKNEFVNWGLNFFIQNPNTTKEQFQYIIYNKTSYETNLGDDDNNTIGGYDNTTYNTFNPQQQPWTTIQNVLTKAQFIGWGYPGVKRNCMDYCKAQIGIKGYQISNYSATGQTIQMYTAQNGVNKSKVIDGLSYLKYALSKGIPVIVGVDDAPGNPGNADQTTDHFIVIVGMGTDSKGNYFSFFDNASGDANLGASPNNKLYYDSVTGLIQGTSDTPYASGLIYTLTQIRKSKLK